MGKPIGVAVVGVGSMGKNHARVFSEIPNVKLVGLSDINEETAREYAKKFNNDMKLVKLMTTGWQMLRNK